MSVPLRRPLSTATGTLAAAVNQSTVLASGVGHRYLATGRPSGSTPPASTVALPAAVNQTVTSQAGAARPAAAADAVRVPAPRDAADRAKAPANLGRSYGKPGTVIADPGITITDYSTHAAERKEERRFAPEDMKSTVRNPVVVLQQRPGLYLYVGELGAVVVTGEGKVVTAWPAADHDATIRKILREASGSPDASGPRGVDGGDHGEGEE